MTARHISLELSKLTVREEQILGMRYGIGCKRHTLEGIGRQFAVTRQRIRAIQKSALAKLPLEIAVELTANNGTHVRRCRYHFSCWRWTVQAEGINTEAQFGDEGGTQ